MFLSPFLGSDWSRPQYEAADVYCVYTDDVEVALLQPLAGTVAVFSSLKEDLAESNVVLNVPQTAVPSPRWATFLSVMKVAHRRLSE